MEGEWEKWDLILHHMDGQPTPTQALSAGKTEGAMATEDTAYQHANI